MALKFRLVSQLNALPTAKVFGVKMFYKCFLEDSSSAVNVVNLTFAFCNFSFVPVMHRQQTSGNEWGFIALLEILTNNYSALQSPAMAC